MILVLLLTKWELQYLTGNHCTQPIMDKYKPRTARIFITYTILKKK